MATLFYPDPLIRLPLYMCLGLLSEIFFTAICDLVNPFFLQSWHAMNLEVTNQRHTKRDPRALGYTFLWMVPLYMMFILIEPLSQLAQNIPFFIRGFIYLPIFWTGEYSMGALIKKTSGYCPWDYSYSKYSLHGYIRWDFAPFWYAFTLLADFLSTKFIQLTPALKTLF